MNFTSQGKFQHYFLLLMANHSPTSKQSFNNARNLSCALYISFKNLVILIEEFNFHFVFSIPYAKC